MSHFTVLVPADNKEHLEKVLLPYHEYECTGIEDHTVLLDETDELREDFEKYGEGEPFEEFVEGWSSAKLGDDGRYYRRTNPEKKWDWWLIGGRWTDLLQLKSFDAMAHAGDGEPGLMTPKNANPLCADFARACDVDWEGMLAKQLQGRADAWDNWVKYLGLADWTVAAYFELKDRWDALPSGASDERDALRAEFHSIWDSTTEPSDDERDNFFRARMFEPCGRTKDEHVGSGSALTFAFIDLEGKWNEHGRMGWWAVVTNENPDYDATFWQFVKSLPENQRVYVVDCHI